MIQEAIRPDQALMNFVLLSQATTHNQKVFLGSQKERIEGETGKLKVEVESLHELDNKASE